MKRTEKRIFTLVAGFVAVFAIICSQFFTHQFTSASLDDEVKSEQHNGEEQGDQSQAYYTLSSSSLPSSNHVELNRDVFFLSEVILDESYEDASRDFIKVPLKKFFEVLLGAFISPNAP